MYSIGGARGLGLAMCEGFLQHGADAVALMDLDEAEGNNAVAQLHSSFAHRKDKIIFRSIDVTDAAALGNTIHEVANIFAKNDVLVCFAGIVDSTRAVDYTLESFRKICDLNTTGTFLTAQAVG